MRRRGFLAGLGASALGSAVHLAGGASARDVDADDVDVLNLALVVEHVESALYAEGDEARLLPGEEARLLLEVAADERAHLELLAERIRGLGGEPVGVPRVDLGDALEDRDDYLELAERIENISVQGYLGLLRSTRDPDVLETIAGIYGVEARHAAVVADLAGLDPEGGVLRGPQELGIGRDELIDALTPFLPDGLPEGLEPSPTPTAFDDDDDTGPTPRPPTPSPTPEPTPGPATPRPPSTPALPTPTPTDGGILPT